MMGFAFPLFGRQMYDALGQGGGNSVRHCMTISPGSIRNPSVQLLVGLAIILGIPFPVWIYYRGEAIRLRSKVNF
jgi:hypothetical protein